MKIGWLATALVVAVCGCTGSSSSESCRVELAKDAKRNRLALRFGHLAGVDEVKDLARNVQVNRQAVERLCAWAKRVEHSGDKDVEQTRRDRLLTICN